MTVEQLAHSQERRAHKKAAQIERLSFGFCDELLDHLDYASRARLNQHRSIVDDRIPIIANAVLGRNIVVSDACFRKDRAYPYIAFVAIRRPMFFDDIVTEARTCIHAENALHTADDPSNCAAYDSADWASGALAFAGTTVCASFDALG
jgi:hypothetical protein